MKTKQTKTDKAFIEKIKTIGINVGAKESDSGGWKLVGAGLLVGMPPCTCPQPTRSSEETETAFAA